MNQVFVSSDECSSSLLRLDLKISQVTWSSSWTVGRKLDAIHVSASSGRWAVGYSGHLGFAWLVPVSPLIPTVAVWYAP